MRLCERNSHAENVFSKPFNICRGCLAWFLHMHTQKLKCKGRISTLFRINFRFGVKTYNIGD